VIGATVFSVYFGFIQFRAFGHAIALVRGKYSDPRDAGEVSHFQALATALSGTVGLGNIAGVAVAISIGGAGSWALPGPNSSPRAQASRASLSKELGKGDIGTSYLVRVGSSTLTLARAR
jgi:hypothetical protein